MESHIIPWKCVFDIRASRSTHFVRRCNAIGWVDRRLVWTTIYLGCETHIEFDHIKLIFSMISAISSPWFTSISISSVKPGMVCPEAERSGNFSLWESIQTGLLQWGLESSSAQKSDCRRSLRSALPNWSPAPWLLYQMFEFDCLWVQSKAMLCNNLHNLR